MKGFFEQGVTSSQFIYSSLCSYFVNSLVGAVQGELIYFMHTRVDDKYFKTVQDY